jgi:hypothetical protein
MTKKIVLVVALLFTFFSDSLAQKTVPQDTIITLERFPCYGYCQHYKLTIVADGTVIFEPKKDWKVITDKIVKSKIDNERLSQIISEFEKIGYFSLKKQYGSSSKLKRSKDCPEIWTDYPSVDTSFTINGKSKTIWHYLGCQGSTTVKRLTELEDKIDEIVNTKQWLESVLPEIPKY